MVVMLVVVTVDVVVVGQGPQSSVPPHPSDTIPQAPSAAHVVGVQHTPNGFEPGGAPLTHAPLQQAWLVRQASPSALQLLALAARG